MLLLLCEMSVIRPSVVQSSSVLCFYNFVKCPSYTPHWFRMICVQCVLLELVFQWNFCQHSFKGEWERCTYLVYMNWLHTQHCYELLYGHVYRVNVHLLFDLIWIKCSSKYHCVSKHLSSALTDTPYTCDDVLVCRVVSTWGVYSFQPWIFL